MITANNSVGPSTLLALNGVISTPSSAAPPALLAVSAGGGASNRQNMTGPVFAPTFMPSNSTAFTNAPTLLPPGPFSGSSPLPTHLFPYFASPNGTLFAHTPPGTFPSVSFNANGSMFVTQPQALVSGNSVNFPQFNPGGMPGVSTNSLFSGPPTATVVLATPMSCEMGNTSVAPSFLNSPCFTACGTNVTPIYTDVLSASMSTSSSGIPMASMSGLTSSMLTMPSTTMVYSSLPLASVSSASNLVNCPRILTSSESSGPIALKSKLELQGAKNTTSAANSVNSNLLALESAEFHRGFILEAIDKLRERKARPDFERISCLLKRQHSIPPTETQLCLGRLAETGAVVCVDYKGNLSYRNPSKWRKTAISGLGMMNPPSVSRRILDAMRFLLSSTAPKGPDESFPQSPVGFTSLQIERALQQRTVSNLLPTSTSSASSSGIESGPQSSASSSSSSSSSSKAPTESTVVTTTTSTTTAPPLCSELTGTNLRISLEREATYGKLARLPNGQYVLDETGERKKSMGVGPGYPLSSVNLLNKRPLPPKGSLLYPGGGTKVGPMPPPFVKPAIAPALDTNGKSPLHKPTNVVSIAPNGRGIVLRRPPNLGKRGRPPGGKVRKILSAAAVTNSASTASVKPAILPASSEPSACIEKRPKLENILAPKPTFPGFVPMDMGCESAMAPVPPTLPPSLTCPPGPCISSICSAPPLMMFHTQPTGFYGQLVTQPPPPPHPIAGVFAVNGDALLSFPDADAQIPEVSYAFGQQQSAALPPIQSLPVTEAAAVTVKPDGSLPEAETCCRCRGLATTEEPFLVCKECGIQDVSEPSREPVENTSSECPRSQSSCAPSDVTSGENVKPPEDYTPHPQNKRSHTLETEPSRLEEEQGSKAKRMRGLDDSSPSTIKANVSRQPVLFEFMDLTGPDKPVLSTKLSFPNNPRFLIKPCFRVPPPSHLAAQIAQKDNLSSGSLLPPWNSRSHGRGSQVSSSLDLSVKGDSSSPRKPPGRINPPPVIQSHVFSTSSSPFTITDPGKGVVGRLLSSISLPFQLAAESHNSLTSRLSTAPSTSGLEVHSGSPFLPPFTPSTSSPFFIRNLLNTKASQHVGGSPQPRSYSASSRNLPHIPSPADVGARFRPWTISSSDGSSKLPLPPGYPPQNPLSFRDQMLRTHSQSWSQPLRTTRQSDQSTPLNFSCSSSATHGRSLPSTTSSKLANAWSAFNKPIVFQSGELDPAEEFLWNNNFFGSRSIPQLTYTLIFMFSKILGLRTGSQLRQMRLGPRGQLKLLLGRSGYPGSAATSWSTAGASPTTLSPRSMPYELLYTPGNEAFASESPIETAGKSKLPSLNEVSKQNPLIVALNHVLLRTPKGFLINHCTVNEHKRCLVCLHVFLLLERKKWASENPRYAKVECYFLSWQSTDSSKAPSFRVRPLGHNAITAIIRNIETTLRNVTVGLRAGIEFLDPTVWLAHSQEQLYTTGSPLTVANKPRKNATGATAGPAKSSMATDSLQPLDLSKQSSQSNSSSGESTTTTTGAVPPLNPQSVNTYPRSSGAHPTCLDYWPELTARARKEDWQCADCKSCSICKDATSEAVVLICDACDRGYHTTCHNPPVLEEVDRNMPWICSQCQVEAYQRQLPQETSDRESSDIQAAAGSSTSRVTEKEEGKTSAQTRLDDNGSSERSFNATDTPTSVENATSAVGTVAVSDPSKESDHETDSVITSPSSTKLSSVPCSNSSSSLPHGDVIRALRSPKPNGNALEDAAPQMPVLDCESACPPTTSALGSEISSTSFVAEEHAGLHSEEKENLVTVSLPVDNFKGCPLQENVGPQRAGEERTAETAVRSASSQPRPEDVKAWTVSEVSDWLTEEGFTKEAETFAQQDIDGASLILMKRMDVFTELGIKLGPAVKIYERIKRLQATCISQDA